MNNVRVIDIIAILFTLGYFVLFFMLTFHLVPAENREMLNVLLGILSGVMLKLVEAYAKPHTEPPKAP